MIGAFVAVVGPSGAGKDSVIGSARALVSGSGFLFPRRTITRPAGAGEDHEPIGEAEFARIEQAGGFCLSWRAHGLAYGVPTAVADAVRDGDIAVVNVSRGVLPVLDDHFECAAAVRVTVSDVERRARLAARGRETTAAADARMNRADPAPGSPVDLEIVNDRSIEQAGAALAAFLTGIAVPRAVSAR
ncbi:MAG: phosphonate metabolism protein/1,5-bisphosphokinase (PRPP-forming) PhnN [Microbacteriaceae bacterium]